MYFNTLNEALESQNLLHTWEISFPPIQYGETFSYTYDDGTKYGYYTSVSIAVSKVSTRLLFTMLVDNLLYSQ